MASNDAKDVAASLVLNQTEKAFQKQPTVFLGYKKTLSKKGKGLRWVRNVGLGFKTPAQAIKVREEGGESRWFFTRTRHPRSAAAIPQIGPAHCGQVVRGLGCRMAAVARRAGPLRLARAAATTRCGVFPGTPPDPSPPPPLPTLSAQGTYIDKKCPFTGNVAIRGRILKGIVVSTKMNRTIVLRRDYLRYITKYRRYEKRHKTLSAHCSPAFLVKDGDVVTVGQCRCVPCDGDR
jgi:ribosomal protein S17